MSCLSPPQTEPMWTPDAAVAAWATQLSPVGTEEVDLNRAAGRVTAQPVTADRPNPPSDVSAMDGYAVVPADLSKGKLDIAGSILPGRPAPKMEAGKAVRIVTGAVVPDGAQAVVKREDVEEHDNHIVLRAGVAVQVGQNIRRRGENLGAGEQVLPPGFIIGPHVATVLAGFGVSRVKVYRKLRVAMVVTGDELLPVEASVEPWQIRDSNGPALLGLLGVCPWVELLNCVCVKDEKGKLSETVERMLEGCDVLCLTGGVSAGTHDFVPDVLREAGCRVVFHKLPIRPGAPLLGMIGPEGQAVMGLPGNPLSVMTTARRLGAAALRARAGFAQPVEPRPVVTLQNPDSRSLHLWWFRPVRLTSDGVAELVESKGSGDVVSAARSDGFVQIPPHATGPGPWPYYGWSM